jgi:hypothetical protein
MFDDLPVLGYVSKYGRCGRLLSSGRASQQHEHAVEQLLTPRCMCTQSSVPGKASTKASHADSSRCFQSLSPLLGPSSGAGLLAEQSRTFQSSSPQPLPAGAHQSPFGPGNFIPPVSTTRRNGSDAGISKAHLRGPPAQSGPSATVPSLFGSPITPLYAAAGASAHAALPVFACKCRKEAVAVLSIEALGVIFCGAKT